MPLHRSCERICGCSSALGLGTAPRSEEWVAGPRATFGQGPAFEKIVRIVAVDVDRFPTPKLNYCCAILQPSPDQTVRTACLIAQNSIPLDQQMQSVTVSNESKVHYPGC